MCSSPLELFSQKSLREEEGRSWYMLALVDAWPCRCSRSSCTQETKRRLLSARIQPGTVRSPTCSRGRAHCGLGQKDPLLLYSPPPPAVPLQASEHHPTAAAPIFTKLPAVGHEMEVTAVWHRRTARCREGVTALAELAHTTTRSHQRSDAAHCPGGPLCRGLRADTCWCRACPPVPSSSPRAGSSSAPHWLHGPSATLRPCRAAPCPVCPRRQARQGTRQGPSEGPRQGVSWQQQPAAGLGNACSQVCAPSPVLLASPAAVPLQGSVLLILSFLPCARQHSLLPALQGNASEAPGTQAGNPSLQSDGAGPGFQP